MNFDNRSAFIVMIGYVFLGLYIIMILRGNFYALLGFLKWAITGLSLSIIVGIIFGWVNNSK